MDTEEEWQTVHNKAKEKKQRWKEKKRHEHEGGATVPDKVADPVAGAFLEFDRAYAEQAADDEAPAVQGGAFAGLLDEAPAAAAAATARSEEDADNDAGSSADERPSNTPTAPSPMPALKQPKKPKLKKQKLLVGQVAKGLDVELLQSWMAEVQLRYSANETAQVEALSDRLLTLFREATLDLGKLLATKGLQQASQQPLCDIPNPLMNALASFVASVSEEALAKLVVPLTVAVVQQTAAAATVSAVPGKGKAGLLVMTAVIARTRPQVLVPAAAELLAAGAQLTGAGRLPVLLWVINQAALAEPAVGVAVWVRLLLPQLLGLPGLPSTAAHQTAKHAPGSSSSSSSARPAADAQKPLDATLQGEAIGYVTGLMQQLGVGHPAGDVAAVSYGADVTWGPVGSLPTVPGAAVEALSRALGGSAAAAGSAEGKNATIPRAAASSALAHPLLPGLAALAAGTSSEEHFSEWLLLAFESAGLSAAAPGSADELVLRSAGHAVACLCGSDHCFSVWESKHKACLRGSARILAALEKHPHLLQPLVANPAKVELLLQLLAALPARHRTFLAAGKGGWQGACAKAAEDACHGLPRKLPRGRWRGAGAAAARQSGSSGALGQAAAVIAGTAAMAGVVMMLGVYRHEVAGIVQAYAGKEAAQQLDANVLAPLAAGLQQAAPYVQQVQQAAQPYVQQAEEVLRPSIDAVQQTVVGPALAGLQQLTAWVKQHLAEIDTLSVTEDADMTLA